MLEPPWGFEPRTYALRVGSCVRDWVRDSSFAAGMAPHAPGCCWQFMAVRGHLGDTVGTSARPARASPRWSARAIASRPYRHHARASGPKELPSKRRIIGK